MPHEALIAAVEEDLALASLRDEPAETIVASIGRMLRAGGFPLSRCLIAWKVIHPLYRAQDVTWEGGDAPVTATRWRFGERDAASWNRSPLKAFLESREQRWRRDLSDPAVRSSFLLFDELAAAGHTDYLVVKVGFGTVEPGEVDDTLPGIPGVVISFCCDRPGGFTDREIEVLERLKFMLAIVCRTAIERGVREAIATTYLGPTAGRRVLDGAIRLGDGEFIPAVVWYSDLRGSTALAERLPPADYIALLNRFFDASAGAVTGAGGEVLDFIGDAVLAIFPADGGGLAAALHATDEALARLGALRRDPAFGEGSPDAPVAGVAIARGTVMFGNIGVPERLAFSVIGPTVNAVARIEAFTKALGEPVLATADIAAAAPARWASCGAFPLPGITEPVELFALVPAGG